MSYTGVFLDEESKKKLLEKFFGSKSNSLNNISLEAAPGWTPYADHMTIKLGAISADEQRMFDVPVGKKVKKILKEEN